MVSVCCSGAAERTGDGMKKGHGPAEAAQATETAREPAPAHTNRLIHEKSPYLLQHAHNPVAWYPWGDEALRAAREQNKPIFLSVGYSTCHWCHVMERESFERDDVAAILNEHYIAIKVDREERPDLDSIYMTATQLMTGRGGMAQFPLVDPRRTPLVRRDLLPARRFQGTVAQTGGRMA